MDPITEIGVPNAYEKCCLIPYIIKYYYHFEATRNNKLTRENFNLRIRGSGRSENLEGQVAFDPRKSKSH